MTTDTAPHRPQLMFARQVAAPEGPVDVTGMYLMHHGFRRDLDAFVAAVRSTPVSDRITWGRLEARWQLFAEILHRHHSTEDAWLWPELLRHADAAHDAHARQTLVDMEGEHEQIDPLLRACASGFTTLAARADEDARAALEVRINAAREALLSHLAHEETGAMALVQRYLKQEDWHRLETKHFRPDYGFRFTLTKVAAWAMHGLSAQERVRAAAEAGPVLMLIWRLFLKRGFERRERAAFRYV